MSAIQPTDICCGNEELRSIGILLSDIRHREEARLGVFDFEIFIWICQN
jgi:hypothetical protein